MASSAHSQPHSGISSQAGLAALRAVNSAPRPLAILELIDAYAAARAARDEASHQCAGWAFDLAHGDMLAARNAVTDALGIPRESVSELTDEVSELAARRTAKSEGAR